MTPSDAATMLSRFSTASGVSIFATIGVSCPHAWQISRTRLMSLARRTNERPM